MMLLYSYATTSREDFESVASPFVAVAKVWGLTVSLVKSAGGGHCMVLHDAIVYCLLQCGRFILMWPRWKIFTEYGYLGSWDGELDKEMSERL